MFVVIYKKGGNSDCSKYHGKPLLSISYKFLSSIPLSRLSPCLGDIIGIICIGFDVTDELLVRFSAVVKYWTRNWEYSETVHQPFVFRAGLCSRELGRQ
jgi:hypothetical protein